MQSPSGSGIVVIPWDLTDAFRPALQRALELVPRPGFIHLVHVIQPTADDGYGVLWDRLRHRHMAAARARDVFRRLSGQDEQLQQVRLAVLHGEPACAINEYARQVQASQIILPPVHHSRLQRMLSVPVSDLIQRDAPCPVLVVEPVEPESSTVRESGRPADRANSPRHLAAGLGR